jgi:hypothetical protein
MKLYATTTSEKGKTGGIGGNIQLDLHLTQGNTKEYTICYTTEGIMVYKQGVIICDTISKCEYCNDCINGMIQVHHHYKENKKAKAKV